jgi:1-acyl-sn-glycerol-3-phosphate acyltransferase
MRARLLGKPAAANKESMVGLMRKGEHQALIPGGFEEATITSGSTQDRVYIKKRAGFLKYCLQHGVDVCPAFAFGEAALYGNLQGMWKLRLALNAQGMPAVVPFGVWGTLLPRRRPLHVVVGAPISFAKNVDPSAADIAEAHEKYIAALVALHDKHKATCCEKPSELEVW